MTNQEFYEQADRITQTPITQEEKVRQVEDLLVKAYENDLRIWVAGKKLQGPLFGFTGVPLEDDPTAQGLICYSSHETSEKEPDELEKAEVPLRHLINSIYCTYQMKALLMNFNIDGQELVIMREELTRQLTPAMRKMLQKEQEKGRRAYGIPVRMPSLR